MARQPKKDAFERWMSTGKWPEVRAMIVDFSKKGRTQNQISERLNLDPATFSRLKAKHKELQDAFIEADNYVLDQCFTNLYKIAFGYDKVDEDQRIEDKGEGSVPHRKIHRTKVHIGPNLKAIVYILGQRFGVEFSERREEIKLAISKESEKKEDWYDELESCDSNKENQ